MPNSFRYFAFLLGCCARFSARPDRSWGPLSLLYNGYRAFPGSRVRPGRAADHSPPSSAVVMKEWSYTSTHSLDHTTSVKGKLYLYLLLESCSKSCSFLEKVNEAAHCFTEPVKVPFSWNDYTYYMFVFTQINFLTTCNENFDREVPWDYGVLRQPWRPL